MTNTREQKVLASKTNYPIKLSGNQQIPRPSLTLGLLANAK